MTVLFVIAIVVLAVLPGALWWRGRGVRERLRLYEDLFANLPVGIKVWRLERVDDAGSLRLVASNPAAAQATGVPIADVIGKTITEAFPRAVPNGIAEQFAEVARSGAPKDLGEIVYSDARVREGVYAVYAFPLPGDCVGVAFENITKRRLEQAAIERRAALVWLLQEVAVAANEAGSAEDALRRALAHVCGHTTWPVGHLCLRDDGAEALVATDVWHLADPQRFAAFRAASEGMRFPRGVDLPGRVLDSGEPAWLVDAAGGEALPRAGAMNESGLRAGFAFPVATTHGVAAVLEFFAPLAPMPDELLLDVMRQVGAQLGRVIEREGAGAAR